VAVALVTGILFGIAPALQSSRAGAAEALKSGGAKSTSFGAGRNILVIAQVAMAMVLLVSAGLMIRTFQTLRTVEPGFTHAGQVQTVRISIPRSLVQEQDRVVRLQNDITEKLAAIPGVHSVGFELHRCKPSRSAGYTRHGAWEGLSQ